MTEKARRFPLSLSAVVEGQGAGTRGKAGERGGTERPQTATRNSASNGGQQKPQPFSLATAPSKSHLNALARSQQSQALAAADQERSNPLVSDAVRKAMVTRLMKQGIVDPVVLGAMAAVPRHQFMDPALAGQAYIDASLPIGHQQTISQPYIVARMIEVLRQKFGMGAMPKVLEIGTGCGYQAAVLSQLAGEVYSIERIKPLHELAKNNLRPMRIRNIRLHYGDGMLGLPQAAPFDGIILAAAGLEVPKALLEQMQVGGRLVAPVGARQQVLQLIERVSQFEWSSVTLEDCHFVPLRAGTI